DTAVDVAARRRDQPLWQIRSRAPIGFRPVGPRARAASALRVAARVRTLHRGRLVAAIRRDRRPRAGIRRQSQRHAVRRRCARMALKENSPRIAPSRRPVHAGIVQTLINWRLRMKIPSLLFGLALVAFGVTANAHAHLQKSSPADNSVITTSPSNLVMHF